MLKGTRVGICLWPPRLGREGDLVGFNGESSIATFENAIGLWIKKTSRLPSKW